MERPQSPTNLNPYDTTGQRQYMQAAQAQGGPGVPALTPEEKVLMDECRRESFYYRALPIGLTFSSLVQLGIANGKIAAPTTLSKVIKLFAAGTAGYVLGKASYAGACREKFLQKAPNSNISKMLRGEQVQQQQAQENPHGYMVAGAPGSQPADSYSSGTQQYDQQQAIGHLPQQFGQQSQQQPEQLDLDKERREGTLSYDHLRNQHRQRNLQTPLPPPPSPVVQPSTSTDEPEWRKQAQPKDPGYYTIPDPPLPPASSSPRRSGATSKYGDEGFE